MIEFSLWDIFRNLLLALRWTVGLSLIAFAGGGIVGFLLLVARIAEVPGARRGIALYVQLFQGTPLLMQLFLTYFGLALIGIETSALLAAALCLTFYASAYLTEIWRGCVDALPRGQWEASASLAMNLREQLRYVILPQAARIAVAPTVGFMVQVIKGTALASVIGFVEVTKAGQMISNATFQPFLVYSCVALMYFALCFPMSVWSRRLERRLQPHA
ncbi:amino acid ABC transporter permease [Cupriavidus sp. WKF15]|uniref:amino acid ABC transporter permease n=1 Tax=Cupriavidus sp. WKF15 TaxID=3032282 RepID=UPI0023E1B842|nr:amino acid ABC transporter permease [Cupriavidus sp. WKF15]WER50573.1 amino acid ABC transporter permease [Cupriavidus sp. WKF15]